MITLAYRGSASAIITAQTLPLNPCWSPFIRGKNSAGLRPRQPKYPELDHPGLIDLGERPACARAVDRKNRVRFGGRFFREISGPVLTRIFPTPRTGPKRVRSGGRFFPFEGSSTTESRRGRIPFYRREKPLQRHPRCLEGLAPSRCATRSTPIIVLSEQAPGKDVPYPLIVVRVQLEHVAVVGEGAGDVAKLHEGAGETGPGPHVRTCFEKAPEVAGILLEAPWSERQFPDLDTLRIVVSSLLDGSGCFFGQKDISISAKRRDAECFTGERYPGTGGGSLPGLVHHVLRFRRRIVTATSGDRRQEALHRAPVGQRRGGAGLRRGFRGCFRARLLRDWHPLLLVPISYRPDLMAAHPMLGDNPRHGGLVDVVEARNLEKPMSGSSDGPAADLPGKNRGTVGRIGEIKLGFTKLYKLFEYSIKQILNDDYVDVDGLSSFIIRPRQLHTEEDHGIFWRLLFPLP